MKKAEEERCIREEKKREEHRARIREEHAEKQDERKKLEEKKQELEIYLGQEERLEGQVDEWRGTYGFIRNRQPTYKLCQWCNLLLGVPFPA